LNNNNSPSDRVYTCTTCGHPHNIDNLWPLMINETWITLQTQRCCYLSVSLVCSECNGTLFTVYEPTPEFQTSQFFKSTPTNVQTIEENKEHVKKGIEGNE